MSEIRIFSKCSRCRDVFLMKVCANFSDLCDTCRTVTGQHASERSVRDRNTPYRFLREATGQNLDGRRLNPFQSVGAKPSAVFLPGVRADEPAVTVEKMRCAIRNVRRAQLAAATRQEDSR